MPKPSRRKNPFTVGSLRNRATGEDFLSQSRNIWPFGTAVLPSGEKIPVLRKQHLATRGHNYQNFPDYRSRRAAHLNELRAFSALKRLNAKYGLQGALKINVPLTKRRNIRKKVGVATPRRELHDIELIQEDLRLDGKAEVEALGFGSEKLTPNVERLITHSIEDCSNGKELLKAISKWNEIFRKEGIIREDETVLQVFYGAMVLQKMKESGEGKIYFLDLEQQEHYNRILEKTPK